jgi:hypothetical protein
VQPGGGVFGHSSPPGITFMKIYAAAVYTSNLFLHGAMFDRLDEREKQARRALRYVLESYHYVHKDAAVARMRTDKVKVFLDSGAFSAYMLGSVINIDDYIQYCKVNADIIDHCSVLDGIGDPELTYKNQTHMECNGVRPIPCFHYGEDEEYLKYYIDRYEYISLGGMVPISTPQLTLWLDRIWRTYLTDASGRAKVKVHGFGLTRLSFLWKYPWYSVDSTSWQQAGSAGRLIMPPNCKTVAISNQSPSRRQAGQHVDNISPMEQEVIRQELIKRGFNWDRMHETYLARWCWNLNALDEINRELETKVATSFSNKTQIPIF